jgi:cell division protease FtsH
MEDLVKSVLRMKYDSPDNFSKTSAEDIRKTALHEAGHLVVSEVLCPGSVGLASLRSTGRSAAGGFIHRCRELSRRPYHVLVALAGKAAVELYYADTCASGCQSDISRAFTIIRDGVSENATLGFGMIDVATQRFNETSENMNARSEAVTHAELERHMLKARDILLKNRDFLEKATEALIEKETLLYSDIQAIRAGTTITEAAV